MDNVWEQLIAIDARCVHARCELAVLAALTALRARDQQVSAERVAEQATQALAALQECLGLVSAPLSARWAALGEEYVRRVTALLHLDCALLLDFCGAAAPQGSSRASAACAHYQSAASLDGSDRRMWQLWASSVARDESIGNDAARRQAAAAVHRLAVERGMWVRVDQRPIQLVPALARGAVPWLDPATHPSCAALVAHFEEIRHEAMSLLRGDRQVFEASREAASAHGLAMLSGGALAATGAQGAETAQWRDLSLLVNGRLNEAHAQLAPRTAALLCGNEGGLRRECASCVYGSAFFSLLGSRTRLRPHCGPTNVRLRAHLALSVPAGDCAMRVGNGPARPWVEGEVLLFDDSFEHEVWNDTEAARLVLIIDLWHPLLETDQERITTLDPVRAARYQRIVEEGVFESAVTPDQPSRPASKPGLVHQLGGLHEQLVGAAGAHRLLDCLSVTAACDAEAPVAIAERMQMEQILRGFLSPPIATAVIVPASDFSGGPGTPMAIATPVSTAVHVVTDLK